MFALVFTYLWWLKRIPFIAVVKEAYPQHRCIMWSHQHYHGNKLLLYQRVIADGRNADDSLVLKKVLHNGMS